MEKTIYKGKTVINCVVAFIVGMLILFLPFMPYTGYYFIHICILLLINIIAASSLRTIYISGQASVGHAAFMGIGAYASGLLAIRLGWSPWITMLLGALIAMVVAILTGYLFTRLRALYFSMVTLLFGIAVEALMRSWTSLTGGMVGLIGVPKLGIFNVAGLEINFVDSNTPSYYLILLLTAATLLILYRIERSRSGMNWLAIAQSPLVASSIGISEAKFRVLAFAVGCFFAGLAGAAYAHYSGILSSGSFGLLPSIYFVIYILFGGLGHFVGPILGVIVLVAIPEILRPLKEFTPFVFGGIMLFIIYLAPQGLTGFRDFFRTRATKVSRKNDARAA